LEGKFEKQTCGLVGCSEGGEIGGHGGRSGVRGRKAEGKDEGRSCLPYAAVTFSMKPLSSNLRMKRGSISSSTLTPATLGLWSAMSLWMLRIASSEG